MAPDLNDFLIPIETGLTDAPNMDFDRDTRDRLNERLRALDEWEKRSWHEAKRALIIS